MTTENKIISSTIDDALMKSATERLYDLVRSTFITKIPSNWSFELKDNKLLFSEIRDMLVERGFSEKLAETYYGGDNCIKCDAHIIGLTIKVGQKILFKPIFIGEIKKQGTNEQRIQEGKKKQAIGNASCDRMSKNYSIFAEYCFLCNRDIFPYNLFLHGCDFSADEVTTTTISKIKPFFGEINKVKPFFDNKIWWARKGGSCFLQHDNYTEDEIVAKSFECCKIVIGYYLDNIDAIY